MQFICEKCMLFLLIFCSRSSIFWDVTRRWYVLSYRRFGTTFSLHRSVCWPLTIGRTEIKIHCSLLHPKTYSLRLNRTPSSISAACLKPLRLAASLILTHAYPTFQTKFMEFTFLQCKKQLKNKEPTFCT
jgi:hypothetical protein